MQPYTYELRAKLLHITRRGSIIRLPRLQPGLAFQLRRPVVVQVCWSSSHQAVTMEITVDRGTFHRQEGGSFPFRYVIPIQAWDSRTLYRLEAIERSLRRKRRPHKPLIPAMPTDPTDPLGRLRFAYGTERINEVLAVLGEAATPEQVEQECRRRFQ